ncbi:MAG: nicotinate-nucleotide--dimethylbenzimidazole phosphoribosyltransferase [Bacteroidales bacterium]|nr:nicotinate-nucleotide--dimethylbenzimidazole phosphoribosyltransferase [Bacteroidales bacterium]
MNALKDLEIKSIQHADMEEALQYKLDQKTKPVGSLGRMEELAMQIGLIQKTTQPILKNPVMLTVAADHGIAEEGVSPVPVEITWQQVLNFLNGGGGIGLFCKHYGFDLYVVDAGVNYDFVPHERLISKKVRKGSRNFLKEPAMTLEECNAAIQNGRDIVAAFAQKGSNVIGFGEMGIANSSPATILLALYAGLSIEDCTGPGCGLDSNGVKQKARILQMSVDKHGIPAKAEEVLATYGGLEIATIAGGMLEAARQRMLIIVDGFITTSAFMAAYAINPLVKEYAVFAHQSGEQGHRKMLEHIGSKALLDLGLRLGEGTGAAVVYPILEGSVAMLNQMTSFAETEVFNITE